MRIENSQPMFQSRNEILTKRADYDRKYKKLVADKVFFRLQSEDAKNENL